MKISISIPDLSSAQQSRLAPELVDKLREVDGVDATLQRSDAEAQDFGTIVEILLGAPKIIGGLTVIHKWMSRKNVDLVQGEVEGKKFQLRRDYPEDIQKIIDLIETIKDDF